MLSFAIIVLPPGGPDVGQSIHVQYFRWIGMMLRGRFGYSYSPQRPDLVVNLIYDRLGMTMVISLAAVLLTWAVALPVGIYSVMRQYSTVDYATV